MHVQTFSKADPTDEHKNYLGFKHVHRSNGVIVHDTRCVICGNWFNYEITPDKVKRYMEELNWDLCRMEKEHCGDERCDDWHRARLKAWRKQEDIKTLKHWASSQKEFEREYNRILDNENRRR